MTVPESNSPASSYAFFSRICEGLSKTVPSIIKYYRTPSPKALSKMIWFPPFPLLPLVNATKSSCLDHWINLLMVLPKPLLTQIQWTHAPTANRMVFETCKLILLLSYLKPPMASTVLNFTSEILSDHVLPTRCLTHNSPATKEILAKTYPFSGLSSCYCISPHPSPTPPMQTSCPASTYSTGLPSGALSAL